MKTALIIGRGKGVWEEVAAAKKLCKMFNYVMAVGPIAVDYPGEIDCWVWFHTELFADFAERRAKKGYPPVRSYWSCVRRGPAYMNGPPVQLIKYTAGGSSGLVAGMIALRELEVERAILAGCPMTADGGQYDTPQPWAEANKHRQPWIDQLPEIKDRIRSMSGWTQELLGAPTKKWLTT